MAGLMSKSDETVPWLDSNTAKTAHYELAAQLKKQKFNFMYGHPG